MGQTPRVIAAGALVACGLDARRVWLHGHGHRTADRRSRGHQSRCAAAPSGSADPRGGLRPRDQRTAGQLCAAGDVCRGGPASTSQAASGDRDRPAGRHEGGCRFGRRADAFSSTGTLGHLRAERSLQRTGGLADVDAGYRGETAQRTAASSLVSSGAHGAVHGWFVQTTRQAANSLTSGDGVDSDQPVVLVELRGTFSPPAIPGAKGVSGLQAAQTWHTAIFIVDAATGRATDSGLDNSNPVLSVLGVVGTLRFCMRRRRLPGNRRWNPEPRRSGSRRRAF